MLLVFDHAAALRTKNIPVHIQHADSCGPQEGFKDCASFEPPGVCQRIRSHALRGNIIRTVRKIIQTVKDDVADSLFLQLITENSELVMTGRRQFSAAGDLEKRPALDCDLVILLKYFPILFCADLPQAQCDGEFADQISRGCPY